jgi:UDP-glucuronate 4-epimerase
VLEGCRHNGIEHHSVAHPVSLYAASKMANELMAHTYSHP